MKVTHEHIYCDWCNKEIIENPQTLISEGSEWDSCSERCHFNLEERDRIYELDEPRIKLGIIKLVSQE